MVPEPRETSDSVLSQTIQVTVAGDLALSGPFLQRAARGRPLSYLFDELTEHLAATDIFIVNLEGPLLTTHRPRVDRSALLHNQPEVLDWLARFPATICTLANNHISDYGPQALKETISRLRSRGILFVGAGISASEANAPLVVNVKGVRLGVVAFTSSMPHVGSILATAATPGAGGALETEVITAEVEVLAKQCDAVIVLPHEGREYFHYPEPSQVTLYNRLIQAGATMVVGHHPHVQQGISVRDGRLIAYSLGNFLLPETLLANGRVQYRKPYTKRYAMLQAKLGSNRVHEFQMFSGKWARDFRLVPDTPSERRVFESRLRHLSQPLADADYATFWRAYQHDREQELKREALCDAFRKFFKTPPSTLVRTLSPTDIGRNLRRLMPL